MGHAKETAIAAALLVLATVPALSAKPVKPSDPARLTAPTIVDANGKVVGPVVDGDGFAALLRIEAYTLKVIIGKYPDPDAWPDAATEDFSKLGWGYESQIYFEQPGCVGEKYIYSLGATRYVTAWNTVAVDATTGRNKLLVGLRGTSKRMSAQSSLHAGVCTDWNNPVPAPEQDFVPVVAEFDLDSRYTLPFTLQW